MKTIVNVNVDVSHNKNNTLTLKHDTSEPLVFAFKAQRIIYDRKKWWEFFRREEAHFQIKDQQGVILKNESDFPTSSLQGDLTLFDI
ncbi:MAG: hypothetical protein IPP15_20330 [Saprospiraceae bacterium]|uniref:Uncharacterized protein n=1 Tax=Candidatus Opimibacter skivensis TaxID=2982028 RepID=A0A9D7T1M7_9BACT|nr:hypothetical protein [Candidatus Opimibacter skivensis]